MNKDSTASDCKPTNAVSLNQGGAGEKPTRRPRAGAARRLAVVALTVVAIVGTMTAATVAPAHAQDANCTRRLLNRDKAFNAYVIRSGVGLVGWRDYLAVDAYDKCDHGALRATISFNDANIRAKGGSIGISSVRFQTSSSGTWQYLTRLPGSYLGTSTGYTVTYRDGGHVDLTRSTRITKVQVSTYLSFGGSAYAPRTYTCDMVQRACS